MKVQINLNLPTYNSKNITFEEVKNIEIIIEKLLTKNILIEKYSKSLLKVKFDILEYQTELLHYCLMASCITLCSIGIEMKGIITSSNIILDKNKNILVDPSKNEENGRLAKIQIACIQDLEEIVLLIQDGNFSKDENFAKKYNEVVFESNSGIVDSHELTNILIYSLDVCKAYQTFLMDFIINN